MEKRAAELTTLPDSAPPTRTNTYRREPWSAAGCHSLKAAIRRNTRKECASALSQSSRKPSAQAPLGEKLIATAPIGRQRPPPHLPHPHRTASPATALLRPPPGLPRPSHRPASALCPLHRCLGWSAPARFYMRGSEAGRQAGVHVGWGEQTP